MTIATVPYTTPRNYRRSSKPEEQERTLSQVRKSEQIDELTIIAPSPGGI